MNSDEFQKVLLELISSGLSYVPYTNNYLVNVTDVDGIVQSYYASTGTAIFRDGNDSFKCHKHTEKNMPLDKFIGYCKGDEDILDFFN